MRIDCLVVLLLFSFRDGMTQRDFRAGYIINLQGDTLKGLVNYSSAGVATCEFKTQENSPIEIYDPEKIRGFGNFQEDQYFASFKLTSDSPNSPAVFAEMLLRGKANLLLYDDFFYLQKENLHERIEKVQQRESNQNGGRYVFEHKTYIGILNRYFSDCLPARLLKGELAYRENDFVDIFKEYSECSQVAYYEYKTPPRPRIVDYYLLAGFNHSSIKFPREEINIFKPDNNFFIGAGIMVPLSFLGDMIFLTVDACYHHNEYHGKKEGFIVSGSVQNDYNIDMDLAKIPIGIKFNLAKRGIVPFVRAGLAPFFLLRGTWSIGYQGNTELSFIIDSKDAPVVFWGGLGLEKRINAQKALFIEFRIDKFVDFVGFYGPNGLTNNPSTVINSMLVFGIYF